jgi:LuxR family maltose regulon positive regulatory protein
LDEAIHHALAAQDNHRVAQLLIRNAEPMWMRGELVALDRRLEAVPAAVRRAYPRLLLAQAWTTFLLRPYDADAIEAILREAEDAARGQGSGIRDQGPDPGQKLIPDPRSLIPATERSADEVQGIVLAIRASIAGNQEKRELAIALSTQALQQLPDSAFYWRVVPSIDLGLAYDAGGNLEAASRMFTEAIRLSRSVDNSYVELVATGHLARVRGAQGQLHIAAGLHKYAFELADQRGWDDLPMVGLPHVWLAKILYEWNDLPAATLYALEGTRSTRFAVHQRILFEGYATLARIKQAEGDASGALDMLRRAEEVSGGEEMLWAAPRLRAYRARLSLALGQVESAGRWAEEAGLSAGDELTSQREFEHITLARVLIAQARYEDALSTLRRIEEVAQTAARMRSVIEILALQALAHLLANDLPKAMATLQRVLALAEPEDYVRTFVDAGPPMKALLRQALLRGISPAYVKRLLAAFPAREAPRPANRQQLAAHLAEPLSNRELEVLRLVAAGASNAEIAHSLVVGLSTVKKHINSIYSKLDVRSRTQALARAADLDLLK